MNKSVERKSYSIGQVKGKLAGMGDVDTDVRTGLICGSGSLLEWGQAKKRGWPGCESRTFVSLSGR